MKPLGVYFSESPIRLPVWLAAGRTGGSLEARIALRHAENSHSGGGATVVLLIKSRAASGRPARPVSASHPDRNSASLKYSARSPAFIA
jgi:hypothetical protein